MILSQPGAWSAQPSGQLSGPCSHADTGAATRAMCAALLRVTDRPTRWQPSRRAHPHRPPSGSRTSQRNQQARSRSAGGCRGGVGGVSDHIMKRGGRVYFLSKRPHRSRTVPDAAEEPQPSRWQPQIRRRHDGPPRQWGMQWHNSRAALQPGPDPLDGFYP